MASRLLRRAAWLVKPRRNAIGAGVRNQNTPLTITAAAENGNLGVNQRMMDPTFTSLPSVKAAYELLLDYLIYGMYVPKWRFKKNEEDEIQLEFPVSGLDNPEDITMHVDADNKFICIARNDPHDIYYRQCINLPQNRNFEKAVFKAKLESGMVYVNITNFKRKEVIVEFE